MVYDENNNPIGKAEISVAGVNHDVTTGETQWNKADPLWYHVKLHRQCVEFYGFFFLSSFFPRIGWGLL